MTCGDLPLFGAPAGQPPLHRAGDPLTSREAAARIAPKLSTLQQLVLTAVAGAGKRGATGRELEQLPAFAACAPSTVRKRLSELAHQGRLTDAGRRDGLTVYVYRLSPEHP